VFSEKDKTITSYQINIRSSMDGAVRVIFKLLCWVR